MSRFRCLAALFLLPLSVVASVEKWSDLDGRPVEAKYLGVRGEYVMLEKVDGGRMMLPIAKLSAADRARVAKLSASGSPPAAASTVSTVATAAPAARPASPGLTPFAAAVGDRLVRVQGTGLAPVAPAQLNGTRVYALYFSAAWCGPCRRFTPLLVKAYQEIKAARPEFELIFVSADRTEAEMRTYMQESGMRWPALAFRDGGTHSAVAPYRQNVIPNLVFIDGTGKVLSQSYDDRGKYLGPSKVLADIRRHFQL